MGVEVPDGLFFIMRGLWLLPLIFYLVTLHRALDRCSPSNRVMSPYLVWLLIVPLFNVIWHFVVVLSLSKSLHREFEHRGMNESPAPGRNVGLAASILLIAGLVPYLDFLLIISVLCWIVYWHQISGYAAKLQPETNESVARQPAEPETP